MTIDELRIRVCERVVDPTARQAMLAALELMAEAKECDVLPGCLDKHILAFDKALQGQG